MSDAASGHPLTLGLDLGTSALKVAALGVDGELIGVGAAEFPTAGTRPRQAEQDPSDWLRAANAAMRMLRAALAGTPHAEALRHTAAIGLTGQLPTLVCLSEEGPVAPAITWKDGRADAWAASRVDAARRACMYARTGMPIDGRYLAPMLQVHFAERIANVRSMLSAKDYLLFALTGLEATEPSTAAGYGLYDVHEQRFSDELADFWELPRRLLPQVLPANSLAGRLSEAGAALLGLRAGIPVSTGAADSVCAAYCMGGLDERLVSISFGSSAVIIGAVNAPRLDPAARYLLTPHVQEGWYGREMDLLATGTGYRWLSALFGWPEGQIDRAAADSEAGAQGLFFPPYLAGGEQGALWNPRLQGALLGLNLRHSPNDIARAYLEGVFFEVRRCVEVLAETSPVDSVRVSGNIVHSSASGQMLADILGRPVATVPYTSPAAIGAALLARRIVGRDDAPDHSPVERSTEPPYRQLPPFAAARSAWQPDPTAVRVYAGLYSEYVARAAQCE
jgi:xylulokinase